MHPDELFEDDECPCGECEPSLEEDLFPIVMTRNEVLFLDDSLTMLIEKESFAYTVTTMRMLIPTAQLPAPVSLIEKIGMGVLHVTDPEQDNKTTVLHLDATEIYMLREICFSNVRIGREPVGYNLKRKFYTALYAEEYTKELLVNRLLNSIEPAEQKEE